MTPRLPAVLRVRDFRLLFAARAISFFGTNLAPIAVAFAVLDLTNSATDVGLAFAAWTLAQVSTLLVGGVVSDRLSRQAVLVASDTASFVLRLTMGVLLVSGHARVWELVALQAAGGAAVAFHSPATSGVVPETVPQELLQQANGCMAIARYAAFPLGAAVGGTIVATVGAGWALVLDGATYGASALLVTLVQLPQAARVVAPRLVRAVREGWDAFTEHRWVWVLSVWISSYFLISYAPFFVLGPYIAKHDLGGPGAWALVVTGEAVGSLAGGVVALRWLPARPLLTIMTVFLASGLQLAFLAARAPAGAIAAAAACAGFAFAFGNVTYETCVQRVVARDKLSRVSAYSWLSAMIFLPAGYAAAGPVAGLVGMSTLLAIGTAWLVVSVLLVLALADVRAFRVRPAAREAVASAGAL